MTVKFSPFFQEGIHFQLFFHTQVKVFLFVLSDLVFFFFILSNLTVVYSRPFLFLSFLFFDNGNHPDTFCDVGSFSSLWGFLFHWIYIIISDICSYISVCVKQWYIYEGSIKGFLVTFIWKTFLWYVPLCILAEL